MCIGFELTCVDAYAQMPETKDDVPIQPKTPPQQLEDDWDGFTSGLEPY